MRKHEIAYDDIEHAVSDALATDDQDTDARLYLGPARSADLLEVATVLKDDIPELAIDATLMRPRYRRLLTGDVTWRRRSERLPSA